MLPEASRGGFVLGASEHNQEHVGAFNQLFYNSDPDPLTRQNSTKWMNKLEFALRDALADHDLDLDDLNLDNPNEAAIAKPILDEYRVKMLNFLDYSKILFLHQESLDKFTVNGEPVSGIKSLALNDYDIRYGTNAELESHLAALGSGLIDQSQKMTVAARATAEKKAFGHRS